MTQSSELLASTPGATPKLQFDLHEKLASPIPFPKPAFAGKDDKYWRRFPDLAFSQGITIVIPYSIPQLSENHYRV